MTDMISESAQRLFAQHAVAADADAAAWNAPLWQAIEDAGYPLALLSEDEGGFGLPPGEVLGLLRVLGAQAVSAPLAETMFANMLLARAGLPPAEGPASFVLPEQMSSGVARVPWGRYAKTLAVCSAVGDAITVARLDVSRSTVRWKEGQNLAGEPRDEILFAPEQAAASASLSMDGRCLLPCAAALRVQQMAGAVQAVLDMSVQYASERQQFGRSLGKFQAIQQYLAVMAGEAAAAGAAASMVAEAFGRASSEPAVFRALAGAAKTRAGDAAGAVASLAHQVHGAIGFSQEYALHPLTRRLWSWRDEYGREADWACELGTTASTLPPNGLWSYVTHLQASFF